MKKVLIGLVVLLLLAGAGGGFYIWRGQHLAQEREQQFLLERQQASLSDTQGPEEVPVDFETLQETNPDVYAWLTIPGTGIDTPILQREGDVAYYLSHDWSGVKSANGAVCSESAYNGKYFEDVHTVLYGNNCSDGSLFGGLHAFADEQFFDEHRVMAVYTPDTIRYYRIFAAYEYDSRHLLESFDCSNPKVLKSYVKDILNQRSLYAQIEADTVIEEGDHLLTLSTGSGKGKTYLVQGVLSQLYLR